MDMEVWWELGHRRVTSGMTPAPPAIGLGSGCCQVRGYSSLNHFTGSFAGWAAVPVGAVHTGFSLRGQWLGDPPGPHTCATPCSMFPSRSFFIHRIEPAVLPVVIRFPEREMLLCCRHGPFGNTQAPAFGTLVSVMDARVT